MAPDNHGVLRTSVRLHDVPNEILRLIFVRLHKEDLKSVRLVCKLWSILPLGLLFDRVYISPHSINVQVFNNIAAHPHISRCITELIYDVCEFRVDLSRQDYFDALCHQLYKGCSHSRPLDLEFDTADEQLNEILQYAREKHGHVPGGIDWSDWTLSDYRVVDRGHRTYLESARQQQEYHDGGELLVHLCFGLKKLPALKTVVLGGTWGDSLTDRRFDHTKVSPIYNCGSPLARTWNPLFLEPSVIGRRAYGHVDFFTVIRALSLSQKKVSEFESTRWLNLYQNTFDTKALMSPSLLHHTVNALNKVEWLAFSHIASKSSIKDTKSIDAFPTILRSMSALKHLSLDMNKMSHLENNPYMLVEIFGSHHAWCHLVSLDLASFAADEANLLDFLISQQALRELTLRDGELTCGNWASALEQFRLSLKLETLTLRPPLVQFGGLTIWAEDYWNHLSKQEETERFFRYGGKNPLRVDSCQTFSLVSLP